MRARAIQSADHRPGDRLGKASLRYSRRRRQIGRSQFGPRQHPGHAGVGGRKGLATERARTGHFIRLFVITFDIEAICMAVLTYIGAFVGASSCSRPSLDMAWRSARLLRFRRYDGGLAAGWGLAFLIVVGGVLNLARVISPGLIIGIVLGGVAAWLAQGGLARALTRRGSPQSLGLGRGDARSPAPWLCELAVLQSASTRARNHRGTILDLHFGRWCLHARARGDAPDRRNVDRSFLGSPHGFVGRWSRFSRLSYSRSSRSITSISPTLGFALLATGARLLTIRRLKPALCATCTHPGLRDCLLGSIINASAAVVPVFLLLALARTLYQVRSGKIRLGRAWRPPFCLPLS